MPRELDPFWQHVEVDKTKNQWKCQFCGKIYGGGAARIRAHLAGFPGFGIKGCDGVDDQVKAAALKAISVKYNIPCVSGESQMVFQSNHASNPNDMLNSNQAGCAPEQPSCYRQTGTGNASASPQYHVSFLPGNMPLENLGTTQQPDLSNHRLDAALGNEMLSSPRQLLMDTSSLHPSEQPALLGQPTHLETGSEQQNSTGLSSSPNDQVLGNSMSNGLQELIGGDMPLYSPYPFEIMQMNEPHNPTGGSPLQRDVDSTNRLQDCSQPTVAEVVPVPSYTSPTNTVQHPDQLRPTCNKEYGNETRPFPSETPMEINPSMASEHTSDSHMFEANLQVPDAATNATGPSSAQDMNGGSPIMNVRSIYANDEEIRNLKRKVEELDHKEAVIKEQMEVESDAPSVRKKPRILVEKWLKETERARNNFQIIDNAETLPPKEQVETLTRQLKELTEQALPQTLLIRDANGDAFSERKLIGEAIHKNIALIWDRLKENHVCKLGICGMGGVGKTTIMMHIHNRLRKDATFDGVLFITVSQDFSIYKLQSDIWKALKSGVMEDEHEKKRAAMLSNRLERMKKCVLILDDVWQHFKLQDVGIPDRAGLKVVLTTRLSDVCSRMDCEEIKIQPLGEEEAWKLFVEEIGPKSLTNIQVEKVAKKIVNRCAGLALAINTMGSSMRGQKNFCVWQNTLNKLERSQTKHTEMENKILSVLTLSYEHLSDPQVKQCFLSCALFPRTQKMSLIEYFIDEGFLDELDTREAQYYGGLAILDMLQDACLLEFQYGEMVMHDLIREMALHIMSTTCMVKAGQGLRRIPNGEYWTEDLEKVSLMLNCTEDISPDMSPNCPKLSTLLVNYGTLRIHRELQDSCLGVHIQDSFFMNLRGLKVLNLTECAIRELPDSLSELANLRALLLRDCFLLHRIPYLGKLKSLRKLDANGCESLLAVEGLEELRNLRYLDLARTGIKRLLEGTFRRMEKLQYLKLEGNVKAEEVIQLKALERLECNLGNVDDFNKYVRFMEGRGCHYYKLIVDLEKSLWSISTCVYSDPEILPEDDDYFYDRPKSVGIRSGNYAMARVGEQRNNDSILIPGDVEFFKSRNCGGMTNLSFVGPLRCLRRLEITEWDYSGALFGGAGVDEEEVRNTRDSPAPLFPFLERLGITRCSKLKYLFGHEFIFSLPLLRQVAITDCEGIEGMTTSIAPPPQLGGPAFPRLEHIRVWTCGNMKRVVESEWLPHFPNLTTIDVRICNNIKELLPHECLLHLPNLKEILVRDCEGIEEIIRGGGENHGGSAPPNTPSSSLPSPFSPLKLMTLKLLLLPQLKSIWEGALSFIPGASVGVYGCPKLRSVPPPSVHVNSEVHWHP